MKKISDDLDCKNKNGADLINCLRFKNADEVANKTFSNDGLQNFTELRWVPTNEPDSMNSYLTDNPLKLMKENRMKDFPFITGNVYDEGTLFSQSR